MVKKLGIGHLITHLANTDNHLYQALTSLQDQLNVATGNIQALNANAGATSQLLGGSSTGPLTTPPTSGGTGPGGTSTGSGGGGGGGGTPPTAATTGAVSNLTVVSTTIDSVAQTITGVFTWTVPTQNPNLFAGVQFEWEGQNYGGTQQSPGTITVPFPGGVQTPQLTALSVDSNAGILSVGPTIDWPVGVGGEDPGDIANFAIYVGNVTTNADGSYTLPASWSNPPPPNVIFAGVRLTLLSSSGPESVPQVLGDFPGSAGAQGSGYVTAPASSIGNVWTIGAGAYNSLNTVVPVSRMQTRSWTVGPST